MPFVQQASDTAAFSGANGAGHVYTFAGGAAATDDLIVLGVNVHNATVTTPAGYSIATSDITTPHGAYVYYKIATGGETAVTIVTSADRAVTLSYLRHLGSSGTPLDVTVKGQIVPRNLFVAASYANNTTANAVATSLDGTAWDQQTTPAFYASRNRTAYGNGTFVTVTNTAGALASPDGVRWTLASGFPYANAADIAYGAGLFVTVFDNSSTHDVATSPDGITWTAQPNALNTPGHWNSIAYGSGKFVAVGWTANPIGGNLCATSADGITWVGNGGIPWSRWTKVIYAGGQFVAITNQNTAPYNEVCATSPDGITWTSRIITQVMDYIAYGNGVYVAMGGYFVYTSPDAITWTYRSYNSPTGLGSGPVAFGAGKFIALTNPSGTANTGTYTSTDGITWTAGGSMPALATASGTFGWASVEPGLTSMVQESPVVTPAALSGFGELALLFVFNDESTSGTSPSVTWPVGYATHINTGPGSFGYGSSTAVQHFVAARTGASGTERPQITWTGGGFVNRVSMFVSFFAAPITINEAGTAALGLSTSAALSRRGGLTGTAAIGIAPTAALSKTTALDPAIRIIAVMDAILSAVKTALVSTPGGAISRPVLAPSGELVNIDDQLSVTVDRKFHVSTPVFAPDATDTGTYLVVVIVVSILRVLPDELSLTAATLIAVTDAVIIQSTTASTLAGLVDIDGFQMGTQHYGGAGSSLVVSVRLAAV